MTGTHRFRGLVNKKLASNSLNASLSDYSEHREINNNAIEGVLLNTDDSIIPNRRQK